MQFNPTTHTLSNGITVILDPMDVATDDVCIAFRTGALDESPDEYGITHFCEHMFCKGTARFPTSRIAKDYIANNGGTINAATSYKMLRFVGRIIAENLWVLMDFLADRLQNSLFDESVLENERGVILDELRRALSDNSIRKQIFVEKKIFGTDVPNGKMTLGTPENIKKFTRNDMMDFISRRVSAKNCLICISGKIENQQDLLKKLEEKFSFLPTHDVVNQDNRKYHPCTAHHFMPDIKNSTIEVLFPSLWDDTDENKYQDICVGKFERCMREKLFDVLRSENGLTYGVGFSGYGGTFSSVAGPRTETAPENVARVVGLIAKTAHQIYTDNLPNDEDLQKYTNQNALGRANFLESNAHRCERHVWDWCDYGRAHDFYWIKKLSDSATNADVVKYTRGIFDGPISIITHGPKFDGDLQQIWKDNFK